MTKLSRRSFLKSVVALGSSLTLYTYSNGRYQIVSAAPTADEVYKLRVIHTNDHHARIEPVALTIKSAAGTTPGAVRNFGGVSRRKKLFDQFRQEATTNCQNILFLDAGDVFQGTLYFQVYKGQADLDFYKRLGYDVMTVGNHEFDLGQQTLANFITGATFPIISANVMPSGASPLLPLAVDADVTPAGKLGKRTIIEKGGEKIGIFGLTPPDTAVLSNVGSDIAFGTDVVAIATAQVQALQAAGCTKIIGLTHVGFQLDQQIAQQVDGIDLIVGGHTHTPLLPDTMLTTPLGVSRQGAYPTNTETPTHVVLRADGTLKTVIVTDWEWGKWVGDITLGFDATGAITSVNGIVHPVWADNIKTTENPPKDRELLANESADVGTDTEFDGLITTTYKPQVDALGTAVIGKTEVILRGGSAFRTIESNMGDLIGEAILARTKASAGAQIAIMNSGGIRATINAGDVAVKNVLEVLPFGNTLALVTLTGAQVLAALENGVSQVESNAGRFPQVAGLRFLWTRGGIPAKAPVLGANPVPGQKGNRILKVEVLGANGQFAAIDPAAKYRVVTNNFMITGGDGYNMFAPAPDPNNPTADLADPAAGRGTEQVDSGLILADVLQEHIAQNSPIKITTDGRIQFLAAWLPVIGKNP